MLASCEKTFFETPPEQDPEALFEDLWGTFDTDYASFEERNVDWQEQYNIYRPQVNENSTDDDLYRVFTHMLRSLNDGHVSLVVPNRKAFNSNTYFDQEKVDSLFSLELIKDKYLGGSYKESGDGGNTYGFIGNTGYLHLAWINENMLVLNDILDYFSTADGLIIDMRNNLGGDFTYAFSEFGRFTDQEHFVFRSKTKNGKGHNDYTAWFNWDIKPSGTYFNKPIVLLTDRYTISAGERTVMAFKVLPNVTHMGDTTNGAFVTKIGKELANGWYYSVAPQKIEFVDGMSYEGIGIAPDIYSKNNIAELNNSQDKTLEAAMSRF